VKEMVCSLSRECRYQSKCSWWRCCWDIGKDVQAKEDRTDSWQRELQKLKEQFLELKSTGFDLRVLQGILYLIEPLFSKYFNS
jgi:hypothetical protein